jgi:hypothetical protein
MPASYKYPFMKVIILDEESNDCELVWAERHEFAGAWDGKFVCKACNIGIAEVHRGGAIRQTANTL